MFPRPSPVIWNLLIINGLVFLATLLLTDKNLPLERLIVLHKSNALELHDVVMRNGDPYYVVQGRYTPANAFQPYQIVSHFFAHGGFFHFLLNMLVLVSIGTPVEQVLGSKQFLKFYLFCGVVGGVMIAFLDPAATPVLGASGAISGVLIAFGLIFPNHQLIIFPIPIPIKAWKLILGLGVFTLYMVVVHPRSGSISHFGHLAGMVSGLMFIFGVRLYKRLR